MTSKTALFVLCIAGFACDKDKPASVDASPVRADRTPDASPTPSVPASNRVLNVPPNASSPVPSASTAAPVAPSSSAASDASAMDFRDLLKGIKGNSGKYLGKVITVRGPHSSVKSDSNNKSVGVLFVVSDDPNAESVSVHFKSPDSKRIDAIPSGHILTVRGKVKDYALGECEIVEAELLEVRKP